MQRVSTVLLALLAVVVLGGAVYVVSHNDAPAGSQSAPAPRHVPSDRPTPTSASSTAPSTTVAPKQVVAFVGDDWVTGAKASTPQARFTSVVSASLGLTEVNLGVPGTGYARSSDSGGDYASRIEAIVAVKPDVVVVLGGRNDIYLDPGSVGRAAQALFAGLHKKLPDATLVAVAPFWGDSDQPAALQAIATKVRQAVTTVGGTYLDVDDPIHGHPNYMANAADPDDKGNQAIAVALEKALPPVLTS